MKILLLTPDPNKSGGVANYYSVLRNRWSVAVDYFVIGSRTDAEKPGHTILRMIRDYWRYVQHVRQQDYELIVINPTLASKSVIRDGVFLILSKTLTKSRIIVFWRGFFLDYFDKYIESPAQPIFRAIFFRADAHIVLGNIFRERLEKIGCPTPIYVETTVVSAELLREVPKTIPSDRLNILFLARIERTKGIYEALDTFAIVRERVPNALLTIAGDGSELDAVKRKVDEDARLGISFVGDVRGHEKHRVFAEADIYFFPSHFEGMPNSVLEAMAMGVPIVCRAVGGLPDFFKNGKMGYITDSLDPEHFADLICSLFCNPDKRKQMSATSTKYAAERFSETAVCERLERIFCEIATRE